MKTYKRNPLQIFEQTLDLPFETAWAFSFLIDQFHLAPKLYDNDIFISGLLRCSAQKWRSIRSQLIEAKLIWVEGGLIECQSIVEEREKSQTLSKLQQQRAQGRKSASPSPKPPKAPQLIPDEPKPLKEKAVKPHRFINSKITELPPSWFEYATRHGLSQRQAEWEFEGFCNFWRENTTARTGWEGTWQNRIRTRIAEGKIVPENVNRRAVDDGSKLKLVSARIKAIDEGRSIWKDEWTQGLGMNEKESRQWLAKQEPQAVLL